MPAPDPYQILGVPPTASEEEIRRAYRQLARDCHPDRHGNDPEAVARFKAISEAHRTLTNPNRRAGHDRRVQTQTPPPSRPSTAASMGAFIGNLFSRLSRGSATHGRPDQTQGRDLAAEVRIPFTVAVRGGSQSITIKREIICERCHGSGAEPESPVTTCGTCRGHGTVQARQSGEVVTHSCPVCQGRGTVARVPCRRCQGAGVVPSEKTITIRIPPGIEPGTRLRIAGEGERANDGKSAGDLYVTVNVESHAGWTLSGSDIHSEVNIDLALATLGGSLSVETVDGWTQLPIPAGTQPDTQIHLKGRGVPRGDEGNTRGDHVVTVRVTIPRGLSDEAKKHFQRFAKSAGLRRTES
ncbi:DnaJ domain-containing protein [Candidatus Sumerlaeota bacterium]|nr:DnaJ domain-containing protein [Candidatus Sumerlaeota bacterium]